MHDHLGGRPPAVDLAREKALGGAARRGRARGPHRLGARPQPTAGSRSRSPRRSRRFGVGARVVLDEVHPGRRHRRRDRAVLRVDRPRHRVGAPRGRREVPRAVRGPRLPGASHRRDGCRIRLARGAGPVHRADRGAPQRSTARRSPTRSARSSGTDATAMRIGDGDGDDVNGEEREHYPAELRRRARLVRAGPRRLRVPVRRRPRAAAAPCEHGLLRRLVGRRRRRPRRTGRVRARRGRPRDAPRSSASTIDADDLATAHGHAPHRAAPACAVDQRVDFFFACRTWHGTPARAGAQGRRAALVRRSTRCPSNVVHHERQVLEGCRAGTLHAITAFGF